MATTSAPHEAPRPQAAARTEQLFTEYGRTVSGLCHALLRDRAEAEDAAQQTFLSAHRALSNGTEPREPAAWLATIARNECWARVRTRMREPLPAQELETASTTNDPLAEAIRSADLAALWRAIEELPRQQRDALLLREFGGLSYEELAAALAVSGAAVESLLFRARQRLRGQLRAVYASITGASWLEALVRMFAGGGAPVAAKVAALGLGAAAVGSTAVVVPNVLENHRPSQGPQRAPAAVHRSKAASPAPALVKPVVGRLVPAVPTRGRLPRRRGGAPREGRSAGAGRERRGRRQRVGLGYDDGVPKRRLPKPQLQRQSERRRARRPGGERRGRRRRERRRLALCKKFVKYAEYPFRVVAGPGNGAHSVKSRRARAECATRSSSRDRIWPQFRP